MQLTGLIPTIAKKNIMKYFIDLFSPETAEAFSNSDRTISGFRISRKTYIENQGIGPGDKFICYCTRIQRFIGVLVVIRKCSFGGELSKKWTMIGAVKPSGSIL